MKTVYLSAFPGSAAELELTRLAHLTTLPRTGDAEAMARALPAREVHLVGFSLGAVAALRIASSRLPPGSSAPRTMETEASSME